VVGWAAKYRLYVILDLHCAPGGQTGADIDDSWGYPWLYESEADQKLTIYVWKRIASHYSNNATVLGYDLLNEPIPHYPQLRQYNERLEPLYKKITAAIRTVDKNHVVILGGARNGILTLTFSVHLSTRTWSTPFTSTGPIQPKQ
jgi:aryl-phospho-beta-D-glucosidase BglC (GH1 family)